MTGPEPPRFDVGIHPGIPEAVYHADCAMEPSASGSILKTLYLASPAHAKEDHPRLNPAFEADGGSEAAEFGTILHSMILGTPKPYRELEFKDYKTDAARKARDETRGDGLIPILSHKLADLPPVAKSLMARLHEEFPETHAAITDPETLHEATLIWRERGVLCRCRFDVLPPPRFGFTCDLKFTGRSAEPGEWARRLRDDYLFQGDLYPRAVKALRGDRPEFRFIVCETDPPYGVSIHAIGPFLTHVARRRVNVALRQWAYCLRTGKWPGYTPLTHYAEAPAWFEKMEEERALRDASAAASLHGAAADLCRISAETESVEP